MVIALHFGATNLYDLRSFRILRLRRPRMVSDQCYLILLAREMSFCY